MARQLTTRAQVNGYRFLVRRLEHALVRRDVRMIDDPMRSQFNALLAGAVLAVIALIGCAIWGLIRPQGSVDGASIFVAKDSGALYVLVDGTVHPAMNLASARLVTGRADNPRSVASKSLSDYPRGPLLGIPGAPSALPTGGQVPWTVCDTVDGAGGPALTVIAGRPHLEDGGARVVDDPGTAFAVRHGSATYLVYLLDRGAGPTAVRAEVDMSSPALVEVLGLTGVAPRPISTGLLNTIPEVSALRVPQIGVPGGRGVLGRDDLPVGSVAKTVGIDGATRYFVILRDSVQEIGTVAAEALRMAVADGGPAVAVPAADIVGVPRSSSPALDDYPDRRPTILGADRAPTLCQSWSRSDSEAGSRSDSEVGSRSGSGTGSRSGSTAVTTLIAGAALPLPGGSVPVVVAGADGAGPSVDAVYLRPGTGAYVAVTGLEPDSPRSESRYYIGDSGVRYGVADAQTGEVLGLGGTPTSVPWAIVSLLPPGPTLARADALLAHDGVAPDPAAIAVSVSEN